MTSAAVDRWHTPPQWRGMADTAALESARAGLRCRIRQRGHSSGSRSSRWQPLRSAPLAARPQGRWSAERRVVPACLPSVVVTRGNRQRPVGCADETRCAGHRGSACASAPPGATATAECVSVCRVTTASTCTYLCSDRTLASVAVGAQVVYPSPCRVALVPTTERLWQPNWGCSSVALMRRVGASPMRNIRPRRS
jgi:hypothetical protein